MNQEIPENPEDVEYNGDPQSGVYIDGRGAVPLAELDTELLLALGQRVEAVLARDGEALAAATRRLYSERLAADRGVTVACVRKLRSRVHTLHCRARHLRELTNQRLEAAKLTRASARNAAYAARRVHARPPRAGLQRAPRRTRVVRAATKPSSTGDPDSSSSEPPSHGAPQLGGVS